MTPCVEDCFPLFSQRFVSLRVKFFIPDLGFGGTWFCNCATLVRIIKDVFFCQCCLGLFLTSFENARDFENLWVWKIEQGLLGSYSFHYLDSLEEYSHSTRLHAYRIVGYCFIDIVCEFFACFIWVTIFYIWDPLPVPQFGSVGYQRRVRV